MDKNKNIKNQNTKKNAIKQQHFNDEIKKLHFFKQVLFKESIKWS